jgi:hypothetical protein
MSEREPNTAEVHQVEAEYVEDLIEVPVRIEGPVRAQVLPATSWTAVTYELTATDSIKVVNRDARRSRFTLVAAADAWIGAVQSQAKANVGGLVPANVPIEQRHTEEVWAIADTGTTTLTVLEEYWTE